MIAMLLALHFVADFLLQSREMGKNKSSNFKVLLHHLAIQAAVFFPFVGYKFALLNAVIHGVIDWNIWRFYKAYAYYTIKNNPEHPLLNNDPANPWKYWEDHWFYSIIGLDQLLHGLTLVILAGYLL